MYPWRLFICTIILCSASISLSAQNSQPDESFYVYDKNWKPVNNVKKAVYFTREKIVNDTCVVVNNYNMYGPMVSKEVFKDKEKTIAHGVWYFYDRNNGYPDSICTFQNNLAHGKWYYVNDTGRYYLEKQYANGRLIKTRDLIREDSIKKASGDTLKKEVKDGEESMFGGGVGSWMRYLQKNLIYPERALKSNVQGKVVVQFRVNMDGTVDDIDIFKSVEYSLDQESIRMIAISPRWTPAVKDGEKVNSFKRQPIIYRLPN